MKESTHKKITKKIDQIWKHLESAHALLDDVKVLVSSSCDNHVKEEPVPVAKKRGRKKK